LAVPERFPAASSIRSWSGMESLPDGQTPCVIMTHNYLLDKEILKTLLPSEVPYIGFLGPKKRGVRLLSEAIEEGLAVSDEQVSRYLSPIGLDIGAASANEIAISVVAEILSVLRNRNGGNLRDRKGSIHGKKAINQ
ncbi:MAG: XdhC family protein, partial [Calditrichota bacterium]